MANISCPPVFNEGNIYLNTALCSEVRDKSKCLASSFERLPCREWINPYVPTRGGGKLTPRPHLPLYLWNHERWSYALLWLFLNMAVLQKGVFTGSTRITKIPRWRIGNWEWVVNWHCFYGQNFNIMSRVLHHQKRDFNNFMHIF